MRRRLLSGRQLTGAPRIAFHNDGSRDWSDARRPTRGMAQMARAAAAPANSRTHLPVHVGRFPCKRISNLVGGQRVAAGAWLGLVPRQVSTEGRAVLGPISKRGNRYLRMLFVQAAHAVLLHPRCWERHGLRGSRLQPDGSIGSSWRLRSPTNSLASPGAFFTAVVVLRSDR